MNRDRSAQSKTGFTLIELLVDISIIAILASLLLPALGRTKSAGQQKACLSNLKELNVAVQLYAIDNADILPGITNSTSDDGTNDSFFFYKAMVKGYAGLGGESSPQDLVFCCPADTFC